MSDVIATLADALAERHALTKRIDLDELAEHAAEAGLDYEGIDALVEALEARGLEVGSEPTERELALLGEVLAATRAAVASSGERPSVEALAAALGKPAHVVRRVLQIAKTLGGSRGGTRA